MKEDLQIDISLKQFQLRMIHLTATYPADCLQQSNLKNLMQIDIILQQSHMQIDTIMQQSHMQIDIILQQSDM